MGIRRRKKEDTTKYHHKRTPIAIAIGLDTKPKATTSSAMHPHLTCLSSEQGIEQLEEDKGEDKTITNIMSRSQVDDETEIARIPIAGENDSDYDTDSSETEEEEDSILPQCYVLDESSEVNSDITEDESLPIVTILNPTTVTNHEVRQDDIRHHEVRQDYLKGKLQIEGVKTTENPSDILTKLTPRQVFTSNHRKSKQTTSTPKIEENLFFETKTQTT